MKNGIKLLIMMFSVSVLMNCGSKTKEDAADATEATHVVSEDVAQDTKAGEDITAKRARIEHERSEKMEQRKLALEEKIKGGSTYKDASGKVVYYKAESDPAFVGGEDAMNKYIQDNIVYPETAKENGEEGTVFVDFVINEKGKVSDASATDYVGDNVDQALTHEALRVVNSMPTWTPGRHNGTAVSTAFSIPITFRLER